MTIFCTCILVVCQCGNLVKYKNRLQCTTLEGIDSSNYDVCCFTRIWCLSFHSLLTDWLIQLLTDSSMKKAFCMMTLLLQGRDSNARGFVQEQLQPRMLLKLKLSN